MVATVSARKLLVGGDWVETDEWVEVRSPYSGELVARVAQAGVVETRRAIDAAEEAMRSPPATGASRLPATPAKVPSWAVHELTEERLVVIQQP